MLVALLFLTNALALEATYAPEAKKADIASEAHDVQRLTWSEGALNTTEEKSVSARETRAMMAPYRAGMATLLQSEKWYVGSTSLRKHSGPDWMNPVIPLLMGSNFYETEDAVAELNTTESTFIGTTQKTVRSNYRLRLADDGTVRAALVGVQTITHGRGRSVSNADTMVVFTDGKPTAIYQSKSTWTGTIETLVTLDVSDETLTGGTVATVEPQYEEADRAWTASLVLP